ncbi:MAG: ABC transporter ATP-binding protein [Propionibacteriaceae bacterium]
MLIRLMRTYLKPYTGLLALVVLLQLIGTIANLFLPTLNARIIDNGVTKGDTDYIWRTGVIMLGISGVQIVCAIIAVYFGSRAAMAFGRDVRGEVFGRVLSFSARELNKFGAPSLITRNTNDVQQVQMLVVMSCTMMVAAPITMVGGVIMALREDVGLSWLIVVSVVLLGVFVTLLATRMGPLFGKMQGRIDVVNRVLREQITGIRVVRAFVREPYETERFARANAGVTDIAIRVGRLMAAMFPVIMFILNASSAAVLWFGASRIDAGNLQVGQLTAYLTYLVQILMSVMMATFLLMIGPRAAVCAGRIMEVLKTDTSVVLPSNPVSRLAGHGTIDLVDVEFSYPGAESAVLRDITLSVRPGKTTAIIGSTGSGKTTLISLLPRLFDSTGGQVKVDGIDVHDLDPQTLWASIGLVPQRAYLFSGTVASNLRYGRPAATEDEMWHALEVAQAADFVRQMPGQLEAAIAQGGTNVSGGQRQRLSIARALIKSPEIYIFDDSFSALDVATDARLRRALKAETVGDALIIVGQRVATIRDADQILVLDDGMIVGRGTHDELLDSCPTYLEIVQSQLSAEEAAA